MSTYSVLLRENRTAQEPSFSAPAPQQVWRKLLGKYFERTHFGCPENALETGSSSWWRGKSDHTPWQSEAGGLFFLATPSLTLLETNLVWMPLSVRPVHSEQSLSTTSRYSRGTSGWTSTSSAQICISTKLKLWSTSCTPCYRIFTFLVLGVMLTHLINSCQCSDSNFTRKLSSLF